MIIAPTIITIAALGGGALGSFINIKTHAAHVENETPFMAGIEQICRGLLGFGGGLLVGGFAGFALMNSFPHP